MGRAFFRRGVGRPRLATAGTLSKVCLDGRRPLGRHRGLLARGEQGAAWFRGGYQQQDPCHPAAGLRFPRRGLPSTENPHLHAAETVKKRPLKNAKSLIFVDNKRRWCTVSPVG